MVIVNEYQYDLLQIATNYPYLSYTIGIVGIATHNCIKISMYVAIVNQ